MSRDDSIDNQQSETNPLKKIRIVLVNTSHPGNIGAVARAMKNMGLAQLYLVEPKKYPDEQAFRRSAGAVNILEDAVVVPTLGEAIEDCQLVIGASARGRSIPWPLLNPRECAKRAYAESASLESANVAFVFGREDRGMTNDELQRCHLHMNIPADPDYTSLNLAMAVQVVCYELRMSHLEPELSNDAEQEWDEDWAKSDDVERYFVHLQAVLEQIRFLKPSAPKQLMTRFRRIYMRTRLDTMEVSMLRGMLTGVQHAIKRAETQPKESSADADKS
jgi:tRNA (cytidine32/uridine32-2'-O)-methyltransferase